MPPAHGCVMTIGNTHWPFTVGLCWHTTQTACSGEERGLVPGLDMRDESSRPHPYLTHSQEGHFPLAFSFPACKMGIIILVLRLVLKSWNSERNSVRENAKALFLFPMLRCCVTLDNSPPLRIFPSEKGGSGTRSLSCFQV